MKRVLLILVLVVLGTSGLARGDSAKTWDDAVHVYEAAGSAYGEARFRDAIALYEEALALSLIHI